MRRCTWALALLVSMLLPARSLWAGAQELDAIHRQRSDYAGQAHTIEKEHEQVLTELFAANRQMQEVQQQVTRLEGQIDTTEVALAELQLEAEALQAHHQAALRQFGARVRFMYEEGSGAFLAVLLASTDLTDFLIRLDLLQLVLKQDAHLVSEIRMLKGHVAAQQVKVDAERAALVSMRGTLLDQQTELARIVAAREARLALLAGQRSNVELALQQLESLWEQKARPVLAAFGDAYHGLAVNLSNLTPDAFSLNGFPPKATVMLSDATLTNFFRSFPTMVGLNLQVLPGRVDLVGDFSGVPLEISGLFEITGQATIGYRPRAVRFFGVPIPPAVIQDLVGAGRLEIDLAALAAPAQVKLQKIRMEEGRLFVEGTLGM